METVRKLLGMCPSDQFEGDDDAKCYTAEACHARSGYPYDQVCYLKNPCEEDAEWNRETRSCKRKTVPVPAAKRPPAGCNGDLWLAKEGRCVSFKDCRALGGYRKDDECVSFNPCADGLIYDPDIGYCVVRTAKKRVARRSAAPAKKRVVRRTKRVTKRKSVSRRR